MLNTVSQEQGDGIMYYYGDLSGMTFIHTDVGLSVIDSMSGSDLSEFDLVFFQKWFKQPQIAYAISRYLDSHGVPYVSNELGHQNSFSKIAEMVNLTLQNVSYPSTIVATTRTLRTCPEILYPCIIKPAEGTRGKGVELLPDNDAFRRYLEGASDNEWFLVQEYIPNTHDYRVVVMGDAVSFGLKRTSSDGSILNNTSAGATADFLDRGDIDDDLVQLALQAADAVGRSDFAGVDIVRAAEGKLYVLEVNKSPEIQTGITAMVPKKTALLHDYLKSLV